MRSSSYAASVIRAHHKSTKRSQQRSGLPSPPSPVLSTARSRVTGCSSQVNRKEHKKSELFVIQKWDGAQREAITCAKSPGES